MDKICFLFGHSTAPENILPLLEREIEDCCLRDGINSFVVGRRGNFDELARKAVKSVKGKHSAVKLYLLLCYHPSEEKTTFPMILTAVFIRTEWKMCPAALLSWRQIAAW